MQTFSRLCVISSAVLACGYAVSQPISESLSLVSQDSGSNLLSGTATWDPARLVRWARIQGVTIALPATYPNQNMTAQLNSEFVKRLDVVAAMYKAISSKEIGIVPGSGGLRTEQSQIELYRKCRKIKDGQRDGKPLDGSVKDDWEDRTDDNLGKPLYEQLPVLDKKGKPVLDKDGNPSTKNGRQIGWPGEWDGEQNKFISVTSAFGPEGWHAYGVAADFVEYINGTATWPTPSTFKSSEWARAAGICGQLGLRFGCWFSGASVDPPHVEWHPKLPDTPTSIPGTTNGTGTFAGAAVAPGTALTVAQTDAGYTWKLPSTIYNWTRDFESDSGLQRLEVYEFIADGGWIKLKKYREIIRNPLNGATPMGWSGTWVTFDPPAKFFPVFTETMIMDWEPKVYPEDAGLCVSSNVTVTKYFEVAGDTGGFFKEIRQKSGQAAHFPRGYAHDLLMQGWMYKWMHTPTEERWDLLRKSRMYDVSASMEEDIARQAPEVQEKVRNIDEFGKSVDRTDTGPMSAPFFKLDFCWNRDTGAVGVLQPYTTDRSGQFELREVRMTPSANIGNLVRSGLPQGAFDKDGPPITLSHGASERR